MIDNPRRAPEFEFHLKIQKWSGFYDEHCTYGGVAFYIGKYCSFLMNNSKNYSFLLVIQGMYPAQTILIK